MTEDDALARLDSAQKSWTDALDAHWSAPPAPGYDERLLQLANAAEEQASAFRFADREGLAWRPLAQRLRQPAASARTPAGLQPNRTAGTLGPIRRGGPRAWSRARGREQREDRAGVRQAVRVFARALLRQPARGVAASTARGLAGAVAADSRRSLAGHCSASPRRPQSSNAGRPVVRTVHAANRPATAAARSCSPAASPPAPCVVG